MTLHYLARATSRFCLFFLLASVSRAQEGHPMSGVWVGDWGVDGAERSRVVVVLEWEGAELSGTINPGPDAIPIKVAAVNPAEWSLHLEAEGKSREGQALPYVIDGKLDDLGTYNRSIAGSWNIGTEKGSFSITRQ